MYANIHILSVFSDCLLFTSWIRFHKTDLFTDLMSLMLLTAQNKTQRTDANHGTSPNRPHPFILHHFRLVDEGCQQNNRTSNNSTNHGQHSSTHRQNEGIDSQAHIPQMAENPEHFSINKFSGIKVMAFLQTGIGIPANRNSQCPCGVMSHLTSFALTRCRCHSGLSKTRTQCSNVDQQIAQVWGW